MLMLISKEEEEEEAQPKLNHKTTNIYTYTVNIVKGSKPSRPYHYPRFCTSISSVALVFGAHWAGSSQIPLTTQLSTAKGQT